MAPLFCLTGKVTVFVTNDNYTLFYFILLFSQPIYMVQTGKTVDNNSLL